MAQYHSGTKFLLEFLLLLSISLGAYFIFNGWMNYGDLVAFLLYTAFFVRPIERLVQFTQQYQSGIAGFERFLEIMDIKSDIVDAPDAIELESPKGQITFKNVTFGYGKDQSSVIRDFNLDIPPGKKVAICGESGVGTTTIAHLIPRFYDINEGAVLIDGQEWVQGESRQGVRRRPAGEDLILWIRISRQETVEIVVRPAGGR